MKEKIDQYAKGIFQYAKPDIVLPFDRLKITADAGEVYQGSFTVSNTAGRVMKGIVCSDHHDMLLNEEAFQGSQNEIGFRFRGTCYQPGEVVRGRLQIISDLGRRELPFIITVTVPSCETPTGKIRDLLQFAELARDNSQEALRLFSDSHFEQVLLSKADKQREIYLGLTKGNERYPIHGPALAMEEFLIAVHKKLPIRLSLEKSELQYPDCDRVFADKVMLHKDTWGYAEFRASSDADFLQLDKSNFSTEDFVGDSYELAFVIDSEKLAPGHNFARIRIMGIRQTLEIGVIARRFCLSDDKRKSEIQYQQDVARLYQLVLFYRANRISEQDYVEQVDRLVCNMDALESEDSALGWLPQVFRIDLAIRRHRDEIFHMEMSYLEQQLPEQRTANPLLYASYYYLLYRWKPEAAGRVDAVERIRNCYQTVTNHWLLLWYLLQMEDDSYLSGKKHRDAILEQLESGSCSPLLYLELCRLYEQTPELLHELSAGAIQALHWGCKNHVLNGDIRFRYAYLISRQRKYSGVLLQDLRTMYRDIPSDDLLVMICQMMMRNQGVGNEDAAWYALGVEHNLKLTDLYENYLYALELTPETEISEKVLVYFSYNNQLNETRRAMLYDYIICRKNINKEIYRIYSDTMRDFAAEQLSRGRINKHLAVIYEEFITEDNLDETMAGYLPSILFMREISCQNSEITEVVVRYRELQQEERAVFVKGKAQLPVFTDTARIFLVDQQGNRYADSIDFTMHQLLHLEHLAEKCLSFTGDNVRLLLHLYGKAESLGESGPEVVELRKRILDIPGLSMPFRQRVFAIQMRFYFENFEGELLDYQLKHMDWDQIAPEDRLEFVEYCGVRHCDAKGMEGILQYGYERINPERLLKLSEVVFERADEENPSLIKLAWFIFSKGKFNIGLIRYLRDYYSGGIEELIRVWQAAREFGLDVLAFSERILAQSLFTEEMTDALYPVYELYKTQGRNKKLLRAFLKYRAYSFLVHQEKLPESLFRDFYEIVQVEENKPCLYAVLKYFSKHKEMTGSEKVFLDYSIHKLYEEHVVFSFLQGYCGRIALPERLLKEQYVEYIEDPAIELRIRYYFRSGDRVGKTYTEKMPDMYEGIRVRGFILFQDETMEYQILARDEQGKSREVAKGTLRYVDRMKETEGFNGYRMLNRMMSLQDHGKEEELFSWMWQYAEAKELARQLLKPL